MKLEGLPTTPEQLQGLRERREILRDQLSRATNRRSELIQQLETATNRGLGPESKSGIQQRLALVDERILQLESDQALTERQLSSAAPEVLALEAAQEHDRNTVDEDDAFGLSLLAFGVGVVLTNIVGRIRRRGKGRHGTAGAAALPSDDPRFERLTHAVDAIAMEVERIGEGQRFVTQLLSSRQEMPALGAEVERR